MRLDYFLVCCLLFATGSAFGYLFDAGIVDDVAGAAFGTVEQPTEITDYVIPLLVVTLIAFIGLYVFYLRTRQEKATMKFNLFLFAMSLLIFILGIIAGSLF